MAQYIVKSGENIWDVATNLYGSIEGVFDLLVSNDWLYVSHPLPAGTILEYTEGFVINQSILDTLKEIGAAAVNGERKVYPKNLSGNPKMIFDILGEDESFTFSVAGEGVITVDWGDQTDAQKIVLTTEPQVITCCYDKTSSPKRIRWYGDFSLTKLEITDTLMDFYVTAPITVDKLVFKNNDVVLDGLFLLKGMVSLDLSGVFADSLLPIADYGRYLGDYSGLMMLDLRKAVFSSPMVIDDYLSYIADAKTHGDRRPCTIYLSQRPSEKGMAAIRALLGEPQWNEERFGTSWKFYINDELITV